MLYLEQDGAISELKLDTEETIQLLNETRDTLQIEVAKQASKLIQIECRHSSKSSNRDASGTRKRPERRNASIASTLPPLITPPSHQDSRSTP